GTRLPRGSIRRRARTARRDRRSRSCSDTRRPACRSRSSRPSPPVPAAAVSSLLASFLDWCADEIAPFGPRTVVVLDVLEAEQVLQHEPREAGTLADAAVGNHRLLARDPLLGVHRLQRVEALERAVLVAVLPPRNALRAGNVAAALAGLRQSGRRENLAGEFVWTADVDQPRFLARARALHLGEERAQRRVGRLRLVGGLRQLRRLGAQLASFGQPLLAAAVHDADVLMAVDLQLPERPGREPVVVVAVEHDRRLVVD